MAVAYVNSVQNSATAASLGLTFPVNHTLHNFLGLAFRLQAGITATVADLLGHSWTLKTKESPFAVGGDHAISLYFIRDCLAGANTVTITASGSGLICAALGEWSGVGSPATGDQHNAATGTSTTPNSGNITTVTAVELALGVETSVAGNLFTANGTPNAWSFRENSGTNKLQFYSQELAATQTNMNLTGTLASDTWGALIATFQADTVRPMFRGS